MSRGLADEPTPPEAEQPQNSDLLQMIYALGLFMEDIEKKIDAMKAEVDKFVEQRG